MKKIVALGIILTSLSMFGQSDRIRFIKKVQEICTNADIIEFEYKTDYVEIEFICDEEVYEVGYNSNMELLFTEVQVEVPSVIMGIITKKLNKSYTSWMIDETALVTTIDTSYYRVEVFSEGLEQNVYFSLEGKNFKTKGIASNEFWNSENLRNSRYYLSSKYDFLNPTTVYDLPDVLREVSGISLLNDSIFYCVQDELGIIFRYNLYSEEIEEMLRFTDIGDFEDITINGNLITVLRSDGALFTVNLKKFNGYVSPKMTAVNSLNLEGLFYDSETKTYALVSKDVSLGESNDDRIIYSLDNRRRNLKVQQTIETDVLRDFIVQKYPELEINFLQFNPSAIAKHPITKQWFVLSATNRILAIYENGSLVDVFLLPAERYYKPEGLAFGEDGILYISSEGAKDGSVPGQIITFKTK